MVGGRDARLAQKNHEPLRAQPGKPGGLDEGQMALLEETQRQRAVEAELEEPLVEMLRPTT